MTTEAILLTTDEAAELLRTTKRRLKQLANRGAVSFVDLGDGELRFQRSDLQIFAESCKRTVQGATNGE